MGARRNHPFTRTYSFIQRYRHILFVLLEYGFDDLIASLRLEKNLPFGWKFLVPKRIKKVAQLSRAERIRLVLEKLGPTFIKMGQALSTRTDLLPDDILRELVKLQDNVPPFPVSQARAIIEKELGAPCGELFADFEETPLAAASIGQVHRATSRDGELLAIKVQRPGIRPKINMDLEIIGHMASLMERHLDMAQVHRPTHVVEEFAQTLYKELDYETEAANINRFGRMFRENAYVHVLRVFYRYSSAKVLTMELIQGVKPRSPEILRQGGYDPVNLARKGCELMMDQIFLHGFFHADPHPGNILVMEGESICFLDFGMMGRLDRQSRELFANLIMYVVERNEVKAGETLLKLTHGHNLVDRLKLERDISELLDQYLDRPLAHLRVGKLLRGLLDLTVRYELRIPAHFFLLIKALTQIEDLGRSLDAEFDFAKTAGPFMQKILMNRYHPSRITRDLFETGSDLVYLLREVPGELRELLKQAKQGKVKIELEHFGLQSLRESLDRSSNRIASAIVLASMIVGSSLIVLSKVPPLWHEIPVIGLAGYLASGIMGLVLLRSIWKDRHR